MQVDEIRKEERKLNRMVGRRLAIIRSASKLSRKVLADKLGISQQQLAKYEMGTNRISVGKLFQLSEILDIEVTEFFQSCKKDFADSKRQEQREFKLMHLIKQRKGNPTTEELIELLIAALSRQSANKH